MKSVPRHSPIRMSLEGEVIADGAPVAAKSAAQKKAATGSIRPPQVWCQQIRRAGSGSPEPPGNAGTG
jgi:hypothetical protein